eukprot:691058-Karenia_brevis.AAC.1
MNNLNNTQYYYQVQPNNNQWACTHCGLLHDNMMRRDCRLQTCKGHNPNIVQPGPKIIAHPKPHHAWDHNHTSYIHASSPLPSSSSHVIQSSLPTYSPGSLVPHSLINNIARLGVGGAGTEEDVEMGQDGKVGDKPVITLPPADHLNKKAKHFQEYQEQYQAIASRFGEDHPMTIDMKKSLDSYAPQVSSMKALQSSKLLTETQIQTQKTLEVIRKARDAAQERFNQEIQALKDQLDK